MLGLSSSRISIFGALSLSLISLGACKARTYNSAVRERPSDADKPELLGLPATMNWSQLKDIKGGQRPVPWTDTYWPFFERGLASRWSMAKEGAFGLKKVTETPFQQVSQMLSAWEKNDQNQLVVLSPAEKYELIKMAAKGLDEGTLKLLKVNEDLYQNSPALKSARSELEKLGAQRRILASQGRSILKEIGSLTSKIRDENAAILNIRSLLKNPSSRAKISSEEANKRIETLRNSVTLSLEQIRRDQQRLDDIEKEKKGLVDKTKSAQSSYEKALKEYQKSSIELARQLSGSLNMISTSWDNYLTYSSSYEDDWEWMGHCHGWAPASLNEATPKHGVLAKRAGRQIFFTEGDIRGLLTKVYADQSPQAKFASQRCNSDKLVKDRLGRVADGKLCLGNGKTKCDQSDSGEIVFISAGQSRRGLSVIGKSMSDDSPRIAVWTGGRTDDAIEVAVYPSMAVFSQSLNKIKARDYSGSQRGILNNSTACRDTNPMTLHIALKGLINDQQVGFVIDKTRTAQVWNQPVHKWEMTHVPIKKNDAVGTLVDGGTPVAIAEVDDLFKDYRAPKTAFLVQMKVKISYGAENGPKLSYDAPDEAVESDTILYTLELDAQQNLVGGEWGLIPTSENSKESSLASGRSGTAPDFLWLIDRKEKPSRGQLDYALIDKIHQCSLSSSNLLKYSWPLGGGMLDYTVCDLDAP